MQIRNQTGQKFSPNGRTVFEGWPVPLLLSCLFLVCFGDPVSFIRVHTGAQMRPHLQEEHGCFISGCITEENFSLWWRVFFFLLLLKEGNFIMKRFLFSHYRKCGLIKGETSTGLPCHSVALVRAWAGSFPYVKGTCEYCLESTSILLHCLLITYQGHCLLSTFLPHC